MKSLISMILILGSLSSYAGNDGRGGGDDIALEFQMSFHNAMDNIKSKNPKLYSTLMQKQILTVANNASIVVVDETLSVELNGIVQNSLVINIPKTQTIKINRSRWKAITNQVLKEGISLHEVLSLINLERTGHYPILKLPRFDGQLKG